MSIVVHGMHGMGDNVHQRAIIRELLKQDSDVWIETPWPCLYRDLPIKCIGKSSRLRTQAKNAAREQEQYETDAPAAARHLNVWYPPQTVREQGSVLGAMSYGCDVPVGDFRMEVPGEWASKAFHQVLIHVDDDRPIAVVRPLVDRTEWTGCKARNPDHVAYREIFEAIREQFFVVSIADLVPGVEWLELELDADLRFHAGELDAETVAGLMASAHLVYASPGFAIPLAQCVGTPSVCVFGGYENGSSFSAGAKLTPHLAIEPIRPCQCFAHGHDCDKRIDIAAAVGKIKAFANEAIHV